MRTSTVTSTVVARTSAGSLSRGAIDRRYSGQQDQLGCLLLLLLLLLLLTAVGYFLGQLLRWW